MNLIMKSFTVYQIVDTLSESLLAMYLAPSHKYALEYFKMYLDNFKGADKSVFVLVRYPDSEVFESYSEFNDYYRAYQNDGCSEFGFYLFSELVNTEPNEVV